MLTNDSARKLNLTCIYSLLLILGFAKIMVILVVSENMVFLPSKHVFVIFLENYNVL